MSSDRDKPEPPNVDGSADTVAGEPERSTSQKLLHDDVKAALFQGGRPREELESGVVLAGRWRIAALIGRGGMGEVYRAHDLELGEDVAIKFLPRTYARDPSLRARFVNEVRLARQITHASVCRVHDIGEADGRHFLSMELIDGEDLSSLLRRIGRLPQEKALELAQQLCAGLAALHARGVLHRDLKPSNVMIDGEGRLKLADFGLAALQSELEPRDLRDGTPAYMAPEQAAGKEVTVKSDIFALGLVLYELIAGRHAFASGTDETGRPKIDRGSTPSAISTHVRGLPPELDDVIRACIDPDPAARPASVLAIAAALPGGDPVAAAIAAGRAPSVEAVAGARVVGTLPVWLAYGCAAFIAVALLVFAAVEPMRGALGRYRQEMSVEVLAHRASEVIAAAGNVPSRADSVFELRLEQRFLAALRESDPAPFGDGPGPILFVYRQASSDLLAYGNAVTVDDPPTLEPGGARVILDGRGLLRSLTVVPPERAPDPAPCDFDPLLRLAGLDPAALVETDPVTTPRFFADERRAWTGHIDELGIDVTVEAAAIGGHPVSFVVYPPWRALPSDGPEGEAEPGPPVWVEYGLPLVLFAFVLIVLALARRSIQRGDADLRGAWRASVVVAILTVVSDFFSGHHSSPLGELALFAWIARNAAFMGGFSFLCYVIVEPYARRYLPGAMVGWTRLIRGHWRDPLVARDVLIGAALSLAIVWAQFAKFAVLDDPGGAFQPFNALYGARHALAFVAYSGWVSVIGILQLFVLYLVVSGIARGKKRWVMLVFFVAWAGIEFPKSYTHHSALELLGLVLIVCLIAAMIVVLITRFGLLAAAAMQLTAQFVLGLPVTLDFDAWYAPFGAIAFLGVGALTLFGLRCVRR